MQGCTNWVLLMVTIITTIMKQNIFTEKYKCIYIFLIQN